MRKTTRNTTTEPVPGPSVGLLRRVGDGAGLVVELHAHVLITVVVGNDGAACRRRARRRPAAVLRTTCGRGSPRPRARVRACRAHAVTEPEPRTTRGCHRGGRRVDDDPRAPLARREHVGQLDLQGRGGSGRPQGLRRLAERARQREHDPDAEQHDQPAPKPRPSATALRRSRTAEIDTLVEISQVQGFLDARAVYRTNGRRRPSPQPEPSH